MQQDIPLSKVHVGLATSPLFKLAFYYSLTNETILYISCSKRERYTNTTYLFYFQGFPGTPYVPVSTLNIIFQSSTFESAIA